MYNKHNEYGTPFRNTNAIKLYWRSIFVTSMTSARTLINIGAIIVSIPAETIETSAEKGAVGVSTSGVRRTGG